MVSIHGYTRILARRCTEFKRAPLIIGVLISVFLSISTGVFAFSKTPDITPESEVVNRVESFSFVVFGDNRDGDDVFMDLIKEVNQEKDIEFAVSTGDFVSGGREEEYKKYLGVISDLNVKLYHVPGNHDLVKQGYNYYKKYFGPFYYSFDYKNSHFVVLNNAFKDSFDAAQFEWLNNDLAETDKENIFVFMHRPTFDPSEIFEGHVMSGRETVAQLMEVFEKHGVDYVFAGHIHGHARAKRDDIVYIVTAGAGAPLYLPKEFGGYYHYVRIEVEGENISDKVVRIYGR